MVPEPTPSSSPSYPDILGAITGGARYNAGVVQVAVATRPRIVRAGRPFEVVLLIQNASDADIDVTATLHLPELDAKKQKGRFAHPVTRLVVGLSPAEVGYVVFPVGCAADTAIADGYKVGVGVEVKGEGKPKRIRPAEGGTASLEGVPNTQLEAVNALKKLSFSAVRRGLIGAAVEVSFGVMGAQPGDAPPLAEKPNWVHLWGIDSHASIGDLFNRYQEPLVRYVIARFSREKLYSALYAATRERMTGAGVEMAPVELHFISKLLVAILEKSNPPEKVIDYLGGEHFNIIRWVKPGGSRPGEADLPHWCQGMLRLMASDRKAVENPAQTLATTLYNDLLMDAIPHALMMVTNVTGEDLGGEHDRVEYARELIKLMAQPTALHKLNLTDVYLPLVMGGIIYYDRAILKEEKIIESLQEMTLQLRSREDELLTAENELVFKLMRKVLDSSMQKYGYRA